MAIGIHVAYIKLTKVSANGAVLDMDSASLGDVCNSNTEQRIIPDSDIASSAAAPTIKDYLEAEAALDYVLHYIGQTMIVTYDQGAINSAS